MEIIQVDLNKNYTEVIKHAVEVLKGGGVVVYPTDTLYGLGANALDPVAVEKIFAIKARNQSKPLPIMVRNVKWAQELAHVSPRNKIILEKLWPGKVTAILPKRDIIPGIVTAEHQTIGMRVAEHMLMDELLGRFGYPLTSTSANVSGDEPSRNIDTIIATFARRQIKPDLIIDVGVLPPSEPAAILDLTTDKPKILRVGAVSPKQLLELLNGL